MTYLSWRKRKVLHQQNLNYWLTKKVFHLIFEQAREMPVTSSFINFPYIYFSLWNFVSSYPLKVFQ